MDLSKFIEVAGPMRALGVIVTQNGEEVARHLWEGACRRNIYSATKSYTSAAVGLAVKEGLISLDEKLTDAFAGDLPEVVSDNLAKATVRDLLTMNLGQGKGYLMGTDRPYYPDPNWVKTALAQPFDFAPGEKFVYNNTGPYLAGILVQRRAGCDLVNYMLPRFFAPMGIQRPTWETDPVGNNFGAGGLFLTIDEFHKLGLLYLNKGNWNGRQILTEEWVAETMKPQANTGMPGIEYGYLFWGDDKGVYRANGKYGQSCAVLRDKNAVVTVVAESRDEFKLLDAIVEHIYPQL